MRARSTALTLASCRACVQYYLNGQIKRWYEPQWTVCKSRPTEALDLSKIRAALTKVGGEKGGGGIKGCMDG